DFAAEEARARNGARRGRYRARGRQARQGRLHQARAGGSRRGGASAPFEDRGGDRTAQERGLAKFCGASSRHTSSSAARRAGAWKNEIPKWSGSTGFGPPLNRRISAVMLSDYSLSIAQHTVGSGAVAKIWGKTAFTV